jgi:NAD(P)-dependent dehydrogenase (short-subunit alcohol dehydrogenase family)
MSNPDTFQDRVILIAGATGALGSAVVREFASTGARLALTGRSLDALQELANDTGLSQARVVLDTSDLTEPGEVEGLVSGILGKFGRLDVLLNTVGGWAGGKTVAETALQEWQRMLDLNLRTAFLLSRAVLPPMLEAGWGRIVHTASKSAVEPRAKGAAYAVSKMGVITLTEVIAAEVKGTGVTANTVLPSTIDTPANRRMMPKADPSGWVPPERIATTMRFLCSDAAASINGARLAIYGAA